MSKFLLSFLIACIPSLIHSQNSKIQFEIGPEYDVIDAEYKDYVHAADVVVSTKTSGKEVHLQTFDASSGEELNRRTYEDFPKGSNRVGLIEINDRVYYLFECENKKEKNYSCYAREVDLETGSFESYQEVLKTLGPVVSDFHLAPPKTWLPKFNIHIPTDRSNVTISYKRKPLVKDNAKNKDVLGFGVFDDGFNKKWSAETTLPYTEKDLRIMKTAATNEGEPIMIGYRTLGRKLELFRFSEGGKISSNRLVFKRSISFNSFKISQNEAGNIVCTGFWVNGTKWHQYLTQNAFGIDIDGVYSFEVDQNGEILKESEFEFPLDFINEYAKKSEARRNNKKDAKGKAGIQYLSMTNYQLTEDGGLVVVGEQRSVERMYSTGVPGKSATDRVQYEEFLKYPFSGFKPKYGQVSSVRYLFEDIVVMKINKDGEQEWLQRIPKYQRGYKGQGGMGMRYQYKDGGHYFIFLDNAKNLKLTVMDSPEKHEDGAGGFLTAYRIDNAGGDISKQHILDVTNANGRPVGQLKMTRFTQTDEQLFVEVYLKNKKDGMILLSLED